MKRIILSILASIIFINVYAYTVGTIYTPEGSAIEVLYYSEMSSNDIAFNNSYYSELFPNATLIGSSSATYNCHSYAWNMTEGGPTCWLNQFTISGGDNLSKYWTDSSYIVTIESNATKVFYYNSDHSAIIKTSDRTKYISKWGSAPLMEHAPGYGPYADMVNRRYYVKSISDSEEPEVITGELVPGTGTYLRNQEYQFMQGEFDPDKYIFEWSVTESDHGANAITSGKVRLDTKDAPHIAKITFLSTGLYDVRLEVYDADEILVGVFTCQPYVQ